MVDRLRAGKLSLYVTSHPDQLSLAIPPWVGAMSTSLGWEGNRRSGVTLAIFTSPTIVVYPPMSSMAFVQSMSLLYLYLYRFVNYYLNSSNTTDIITKL